MATEETWKPVVGFPGYEVSDYGRVRSWLNTGGYGHRAEPKIRKVTAHKNGGHLWLALRSGGKYQYRFVHRLVLEAFVGPCPTGQEGCHRDDDPTNNHLSNLRWDTRPGNLADRKR